MNVLLVDDEATMRKMLKIMLRKRGYQVFEASSGEEAFGLLFKHPIDILVTDVVMEEMDGMALADSVLQWKPDLPVVFISGYPVDVETTRCRYPRSAFVPKPFPAEDLTNSIEELTGAMA
jgi:CheY-like chemotaxis protein